MVWPVPAVDVVASWEMFEAPSAKIPPPDAHVGNTRKAAVGVGQTGGGGGGGGGATGHGFTKLKGVAVLAVAPQLFVTVKLTVAENPARAAG